jgi:hypothetical protein
MPEGYGSDSKDTVKYITELAPGDGSVENVLNLLKGLYNDILGYYMSNLARLDTKFKEELQKVLFCLTSTIGSDEVMPF